MSRNPAQPASLFRSSLQTLVDAARAWSNDRAVRLGAGLAYYSLFALIPVLLLAVSLAGIVFGQDVAGGAVEGAIAERLGPEIATLVTTAIDRLRTDSGDALVPLIALGTLLFTATVLFVAWKDVVGIIWDVPRQTGIRASIKRRLFALAAVLGSGLLLSLVIFAEALVGALDQILASGTLDILLKIMGSIIPSLLGVLFLAVLFKYTPDTVVAWRSVWLAAAVTIGMLSLGAWGYGVYLGAVGLKSASGVAGTILLGLALVYYSAQILLYGVEVSKKTHEKTTKGG